MRSNVQNPTAKNQDGVVRSQNVPRILEQADQNPTTLEERQGLIQMSVGLVMNDEKVQLCWDTKDGQGAVAQEIQARKYSIERKTRS